MQLNAPMKDIEKELVQTAYRHVQSQKTLYIVIDDAHLLNIGILRKLRLLFEPCRPQLFTSLRPAWLRMRGNSNSTQHRIHRQQIRFAQRAGCRLELEALQQGIVARLRQIPLRGK
jgi:type II secretory pathway predicted ATPase ExeA